MTSQRQKLTDEQHIMALVPRGHLLDVVPNKLEARPVARSTKLPPFVAASKSAATWSYIFRRSGLLCLAPPLHVGAGALTHCGGWASSALCGRWSGRHSLQRCIASWWSLHFRALVARSAVIARARRGLHTWARICHSFAKIWPRCLGGGPPHGSRAPHKMPSSGPLARRHAHRTAARGASFGARFWPRSVPSSAAGAPTTGRARPDDWRRYRRAACARHFAMWVKACDRFRRRASLRRRRRSAGGPPRGGFERLAAGARGGDHARALRASARSRAVPVEVLACDVCVGRMPSAAACGSARTRARRRTAPFVCVVPVP